MNVYKILAALISLSFLSSPLGFSQTVKLDKYKEQTNTKVRIASASIMPVKWNKEKNWSQIKHYVTIAAHEHKADIVVTPEGVLEGYVINEVNREPNADKKKELQNSFFALGEPLDGPYIQKACNLASQLDIFLVLGFLEKAGTQLYNTAIMIDGEGDIVSHYRKTHFAQGYEINPKCYQPGNNYPVFDTPFGKVGFLICYDRQLPEPARIVALKGARILLLPSYGSYDEGNGWNTTLLRTRAYENRYPLVFSHPKQSLLITRGGEVEVIGKQNQVVSYEVSTSPHLYKDRFNNRRPETYDLLIETDSSSK